MIVTSSLEARTLYVSPASLKLIGYEAEEATGLPALDFLHPRDRAMMIRAFRSLITGGTAERLRWRGKHKTGNWIWFESKPALLADPDTGDLGGFVDVVRDVTLQVRQEEELRQARAVAEAATAVKTEFLANMSHELRTPLTSILGFSSLLRGHVDRHGAGASYLDRVAGACDVLMSIVNDILDFSKLESGQVQIDRRTVSPASVVESAVEVLAPQACAKGLSLTFETTDAVPANVLLDDIRVRQVVLNLVSNAVKFTTAGAVCVRLSYASERLRCDVSDTGPGIPAGRLDRLFKRFSQVDASTTRSHGGTGLGLAICKGLIEAMGGHVGAQSCEGSGSTFWFEVPCEEQTTKDVKSPEAFATVDLEVLIGLRLLVADDNPVNQELIRLLCTSAEIDVTIVSSGEAALEAAATIPFDIILLDIRMPGLGGAECGRLIRATPGVNDLTPIIAWTAEFETSEVTASWRPAFNDRVAKPIVATELFKTLERWAPGSELVDLKEVAFV